jgi:hypothetical protein
MLVKVMSKVMMLLLLGSDGSKVEVVRGVVGVVIVIVIVIVGLRVN